MPVKNVFRCIVKHLRFLNDSKLNYELFKVKSLIRNPSPSPVRQRQQIADLFLLEQSLRRVRLGQSSLAQAQSIIGDSRSHTSKSPELNQSGSLDLYMQHKMRRYDAYNPPPPKDSALAAEVHRKAAFANQFWNFAHQYNQCAGVHPDVSKVKDAKLKRWSVLMGTILAPYEGCRKRQQQTKKHQPTAKAVRVKIVERNSLSLPVLHVSGSVMRNRGFKRHIAAVSRDLLPAQRQIDEQIWLATQYSQDPLDGEDMTEFIAALRTEKLRLKNKFFELEQRMEVQRRILLRRKAQIEQNLAWKFRRQVEFRTRRAKSDPPSLLTLSDL